MADRKNKYDKKLFGAFRPGISWLWTAIFIFIIIYSATTADEGAPLQSDWSAVGQMIERGEVEKIEIVNRDVAQVFLKEEAVERYRSGAEGTQFRKMPAKGVQLVFNIGSVDTFRQDFDKATGESGNSVVLKYDNNRRDWFEVAMTWLPWLFFIGIWIFLMRGMTRGGVCNGETSSN